MQKKKVAVIGAGLAGLGICRALLNYKNIEVHLFDPLGPGKGASSYALGIFNLFAGARMRLNPWGYQPFEEITAWLKEMDEKVVLQKGLIKIATTEMQKKDFAKAAQKYEEIKPLEKKDHYFISSAFLLNMEGYLEGLFQSCLNLGLKFEQKEIKLIDELGSFDTTVIASGEKTAKFKETTHLVIRPMKGQILKGKLKEPLKYPISSKVHIVPLENKEYLLGATYERDPDSFDVDEEKARSYLIPEILKIYPEFDPKTIVSCCAGVRATTPQRKPYLGAVKKGLYVFAGLGSKGLLCHAPLGKKLAKMIIYPEGEKYILGA